MMFDVDWTGARSVRFREPFLKTLERQFSRAVPEGKGKRVTVAFVSSLKMRTMNRIYRGFDRATDVLSFSALEGDVIPGSDDAFVGDIMICLPYVRASAKEQHVAFIEELVRMFVHGAMHCLGYDHMNEKDAAKMMPLQESIIRNVMKSYVA